MNTDTITAVITGDNHLGTYYARLRPDRLQSRREALQLGFQKAVDTALAEKADLFLIVGDLFDRPDPRNADRNFVATQLCRLRDAGVKAVAICGNHDSPRLGGYDGGIVPLHEMASLGGLHLMRGETLWESLTLDIPVAGGSDSVSVRIRGRSHDFRQAPGECPLAEDASLGEPRTAAHEIVLLHYGVEDWQPFENEPILKRENLNRLGADVIAVGHLHARNQARLPGGALLLNPGATERMDWGEERLKTGCAVVRLRQSEPATLEWCDFSPQPMRTLTVKAADLDAACAGDDGATAATDWINGRIEDALAESGAGADRQMLRLRVEGMASEATFHQLDLDAVRRFGTVRCFHLDIDAEDLTVRYADGEIADVSGGFEIDTEIEAVVAALLAQAKPGEGATETECVDAARRDAVLRGAKDALLSAYQRIVPGS